MKFENGKMSGVRIAYIGGGSRGWAWGLMSDLVYSDCCFGIIDHVRADPFVQPTNLFTISQCLHFSDQFVCGRIGSGPVHFVSVDRIALLTGILDRKRDAVCNTDQQIFKLLPVAIDVIMDSFCA